jgi:selenocysteine-specific translation elongation factor
VGPSGSGSVTVCGRVSSGCCQLGDPLLALPINEWGTVKAINVGDDDSIYAVAGDRVSITLNNLDTIQFHLGSVICTEGGVSMTDLVQCEITTFAFDVPLTIGVPVVFHHLGTSESAFITS